MTARYLIRLDDAVSTMQHKSWLVVEQLLDQYNIRPMVAVIPKNRDQTLLFSPENPLFWDTVRRWQTKGWSIALHGLDHVYHHVNRKDSMVPLHPRSEFVGLSLTEQRLKFAQALSIFEEQGISPDLFIAPSHSFDEITIKAMKAETNLCVVSDGISLGPYLFDGVWFIPQQLWGFKWRPFGIWTICLHPNTITNSELSELEVALSRYKEKFISFPDLNLKRYWYDFLFGRIFSAFFWSSIAIKKASHYVKSGLQSKS